MVEPVNEPVNEQLSEDFHVGGRDREMPPELQLEQLVTYIEATYDQDAAQYLALLPDRITHAAMLMLGSAVDHAMPAVAFADGVTVESVELGEVFVPSSPTGAWAVSLNSEVPGHRSHAWQPDVAAAAELSGVTILDVNDVADAEAALAYARERAGGAGGACAGACSVWAFGSAATSVPSGADAYALTFPVKVPPETFAAVGSAPVLVQVASRDEVAAPLPADLPVSFTRAEYFSTHFIATPAEMRRRVRDVAEFLAAL
ncbi:alpha/beta hydrolase fold domain-containing protein [Corynebacterium riegelii]|nr:alpha/beta hydrolase [Corynebacterium riegelii]